MNKIKIAFTMNHGNWISETIVKFTKDSQTINSFPISHAISILGQLNNIDIAMSSDEILNNLIDVDRYRNSNEYSMRIYELPMPEGINLEERTKKVIEKQNQKIYPHFELIWFIYRYYRRKLKKNWTGNNWFSYSYFCSEGVGHDLKDNGFHDYFKDIDLNTMDAIELENIVLKIPGIELVELWEKGKKIEVTSEIKKQIFG